MNSIPQNFLKNLSNLKIEISYNEEKFEDRIEEKKSKVSLENNF